MSTRIFGSGIRRREDPRLITGTATYTDDLTLPRMVYAAMLRSPHAHARITSIDTSKAAAAARVESSVVGVDDCGADSCSSCVASAGAGFRAAADLCESGVESFLSDDGVLVMTRS